MSTSRWRINSVTYVFFGEPFLQRRLHRGKACGGGAVLLDILGNDITAHNQDIAVYCDHVMPGSAGQAGDVRTRTQFDVNRRPLAPFNRLKAVRP